VKRRAFLALAAAVLAAAPARAEQPTPPRRIGLLMPSTAAATTNLVAAFEEGLREHGYVKGRDQTGST
jgi:ABC-type sugar transport system substrate-binding protein